MGDSAFLLRAEDFDAWAPGQAGPGLVGARLELQARLVAFARRVAARLASRAGSAQPPLVHATHVDAEAAPGSSALRVDITLAPVVSGPLLPTRATLALVVDASGLRAVFRVAIAARGDLAAVLAVLDRDEARLVAALRALPEPFALRVCEGAAVTLARDVGSLDASELRAALDAEISPDQGVEPERSLEIGWVLDRAFLLENAAILEDELEAAFVALEPLHAVFGARHEASPGSVDDAKLAPSIDPAASPVEAAPAPASALDKPTFEKGARVRVVSGPFEGKVGTIEGVDARGGARVLLGLLIVRIDALALEPAHAAQRPAMQSSHRRPDPSRLARAKRVAPARKVR